MVNKLKINVDLRLQKAFKRKNIDIELGYNELENWQILKTTQWRTLTIEVICDECLKTVIKTLKSVNINNSYLCRSCIQKGERNYSYGKPSAVFKKINDEIKLGLRKNPFSDKEINKRAVLTKQRNGSNKTMLNKKHSTETRKRMSLTRIEKIKSGEIVINTDWKIRNKYFDEIMYQSTYELDFLYFMKSKNLLHLVNRGITIKYNDDNKIRKYFSDYFIPKLNLIIEIKSTWVLNTKNMKDKELGVLNHGYKFLMILDKNYLELDRILNEKV